MKLYFKQFILVISVVLASSVQAGPSQKIWNIFCYSAEAVSASVIFLNTVPDYFQDILNHRQYHDWGIFGSLWDETYKRNPKRSLFVPQLIAASVTFRHGLKGLDKELFGCGPKSMFERIKLRWKKIKKALT